MEVQSREGASYRTDHLITSFNTIKHARAAITKNFEWKNFQDMIWTWRLIKIENQKSIDWGVVKDFDFFPFTFFPPFLFIFFFGFSSATGCVLSKCWWMDPRGSAWKAGWLRTILNCFPSFNISFCLDLEFNLNSAAGFDCWGDFNSGRNSVRVERSYAFNFFCRLRSFFFWMIRNCLFSSWYNKAETNKIPTIKMKEEHSIVRHGHQEPIKTPIDICRNIGFKCWLICEAANTRSSYTFQSVLKNKNPIKTSTNIYQTSQVIISSSPRWK